MELSAYPTSIPAEFTIGLVYRECFPFGFGGPIVEPLEMSVGEKGLEVDMFFDQFPCTWEQEYFVEIVDKKTGAIIQVPAFITPDGEVILIDTPDNRDIGSYEIRVCSTIYNFLNTTSCTSFDLVVIPVPEVIIWSVEPEFMVNLEDKRVKVGESLTYSLGNIMGSYGYLMDVSLILADAFRFSTYDEDLNIFKVVGNMVSRED